VTSYTSFINKVYDLVGQPSYFGRSKNETAQIERSLCTSRYSDVYSLFYFRGFAFVLVITSIHTEVLIQIVLLVGWFLNYIK